ncbi:CD48 antigen [Anabarilius grahami]|uniref:CD48 antigen n=1 Tax=Anabarilius grahami TaxID=495550 RepID=A0A3N0Y1M8_ANAGA|nr:CD48 antigen [Anabarilius grahami]
MGSAPTCSADALRATRVRVPARGPFPIPSPSLPIRFLSGFSAEISVFVQTGNSVQLDIQTQELPEFDVLSWTNYKSENIVRFIHASKTVRPHPSYKDRVDFNDETFSLTLKNMQKTDSGLYTARTSGESEKIIATYRISVIDAVEDPVLTVNSNWSSSDSCTVNFTCRAHDLMINSSYQNNSCSPEEVTSHQIYTLILNCTEESIICNHSNPVSSKKDRIEIKPLCVNNKDAQTSRSFSRGFSGEKGGDENVTFLITRHWSRLLLTARYTTIDTTDCLVSKLNIKTTPHMFSCSRVPWIGLLAAVSWFSCSLLDYSLDFSHGLTDTTLRLPFSTDHHRPSKSLCYHSPADCYVLMCQCLTTLCVKL